ncbi:MAG TPA: exodeoxyribonuclease VII small subunit [Candidatus Limnocylindrales bacterium]|nr:exodeoxyribonuclease VII small subunit [Candidatus Limnocylindrales bacterium]
MQDDVDAMTYEEAVTELERAVALLGREQDDLELAVRTYERGLALARRCARLLDDARLRLDQIIEPGAPA